MANSRKPMSEKDFQHVLRSSFNDTDKSLATGSFITNKVGRKIVQTITTTSITNDTLIFDYQEDGSSLYQVKVIYSDGTRETMLSVERIS